MAWSNDNTSVGIGGLKKQFDEMFPSGDRSTPLLDELNDGKKVYEQILYWDQEKLAAAGTAAVLEGAEITPSGVNVTTTLQNYVQDSVKDWSLSTRAAALDYAGRKDEVKRQQMIKMLELRRSIEFDILNSTSAGTTGSQTGSAGLAAGLLYFISAKGGFGGSGAAAMTGTVAQAITGAALTTGTSLVEKDVRLVVDGIAGNAGVMNSDYAIVAPFSQISQIQDWATVSGSILRTNVANGVINRRVKEVDFNLGTVKLIATALGVAKYVYILDLNTIKVCFVQGRAPIVHTWDCKPDGKGGQAHALRFSGFFHSIWTLQVTNPAANGLIVLT